MPRQHKSSHPEGDGYPRLQKRKDFPVKRKTKATTAEESLSNLVGRADMSHKSHKNCKNIVPKHRQFSSGGSSIGEDSESSDDLSSHEAEDLDEGSEIQKTPFTEPEEKSGREPKVSQNKKRRSPTSRRNMSSQRQSHVLWPFRYLIQMFTSGISTWLFILLVLSSLAFIVIAYPFLQLLWNIFAALVAFITWIPRTSLQASHSSRMTANLCKIPIVPWVMDCNTSKTSKTSVLLEVRVCDTTSDAMDALSNSPDEFFDVTRVLAKFRRDLAPIADKLPLDAAHQVIEDITMLKVKLRRYDDDHDLLLRKIDLTSTALVDRYSSLSDPPWYSMLSDLYLQSFGIRTAQKRFQSDVAFALDDWSTDLGRLYDELEFLIERFTKTFIHTQELVITTSDSYQKTEEQKGYWMRVVNHPVTPHQLALVDKLNSHLQLLELLRKSWPLLNATRDNVLTAQASIDAARIKVNRYKPKMIDLINGRSALVGKQLQSLEATVQKSRMAKIHRDELRISAYRETRRVEASIEV